MTRTIERHSPESVVYCTPIYNLALRPVKKSKIIQFPPRDIEARNLCERILGTIRNSEVGHLFHLWKRTKRTRVVML